MAIGGGATVLVVAFAAIGGVLFGLDQGNWGGAIEKEDFIEAFCRGSYEACHDPENLPEAYSQFLSLGSSLLQLGAAVGALVVAPTCAAQQGRRETMFLGSVVTVAGALPQALVTYVPGFLFSRFIAGAGVGIVTYALPMFVSEVAPANLRGALVSSMQLTMVIGTVVASVLNLQPWFNYKFSFTLPAFPAAIVAAGIFCFPVSPRFALIKGRRTGIPDGGEERARRSLRILRGSNEAADEELRVLQQALDEGACEEESWGAIWRSKSILRRVVIANMLQWLQQLTGVNAILSYGPAIFSHAGVPLSGLQCAVVTNLCNLIGTVAMMVVIDRWGRRLLLLLGASSMMLCMAVAAALAHALEEDEGSGLKPAYVGWSLLFCVCLYMGSFAIAWGGVPWVYPSEIFPMSVKEKALATSTCSQWAANFLIAYVVPQQVEMMKVAGTFTFYAGCLAGTLCLVYCFVPETKGLPLEEMGRLFGDECDATADRSPAMARTETRSSSALPLAHS